MKYLLLLILSFFIKSELNSKCNPPAANNCIESNIFCSLSELNGYCCSNTDYSNPTGCTPLCPTGGASHNTGWWAFVTQGGSVSFKITFNNCSVNGTGVQMGIWGDCSCTESIVCNPNCNGPGTYQLNTVLKPCQTYYLFVDGCSGDVCEFCITTNEQNSPGIPLIESISGLDTVCAGACNVKYLVNFSASCFPFYQWTLDSMELAYSNSEIYLDFNKAGIFQLCVRAYIGTSDIDKACSISNLFCKQIAVSEPEVRFGTYRFICNEYPFNWHGQIIENPGTYIKRFNTRPNCCFIDSIVEFDFSPQAQDSQVYHISCGPNDPFVDQRTNTMYYQCSHKRWISLGIKSLVYPCDSGYSLNLARIDYDVKFSEICENGEIQLIAKIRDIPQACDTSQFKKSISTKWFLKKDSLKTKIGIGDSLKIYNPDDYCYEIRVESSLNTLNKKCSFEFCENLDESIFIPQEICPSGPKYFEQGKRSIYFAHNSSLLKNKEHQWRIIGGRMRFLFTSGDTSSIEINWDDSTNLGWVCYSYSSDCEESKECCQPVQLLNSVTESSKQIIAWSIFPNPAQYQIHIANKNDMLPSKIEFYNNVGVNCMSVLSPTSSSIDIGMLPNGIYYVKIFNQTEFQVQKIIISRL